MPFGTVCVSTVGNRPRTWSSYSNIRAKDAQDIQNMNSTDEILVYKDPNDVYPSPTLARRTLGCSYDLPDKSPKKEKKWSISNIFRRKKKDESESSSEEEFQKKGFLGRRKKKPESRRKKPKTLGTFDHVVIPPGPRNSFHNGYNCNEENGVLSDPTGGFSHYIGRALPRIPTGGDSCQKMSRESLNESNLSKVSIGSGSVDSIRKSRKEMTKVRAEARRTSSKNGSSSEEESQRSNSSLKVRSEENLQARENSANRRSRAARTERYLKRHSRDGENPHNYLRLSKSDVENSSINWKQSDDSNRSPSRSPLVLSSVIPTDAKNKLSFSSLNSSSNISGLSTIPPSHGNHAKYRVSNSTSNPSYKPPQSMNDYNNSTKRSIDSNIDKYFIEQRSISCDANIHNIAPSPEFPQEVLHIQFPITRPNLGQRNRILHDTSQLSKIRQPPPTPPPRDPSRVGNHFHENSRSRPNTFYFDSSGQTKSKSFTTSHAHPGLQQTKKFNSFNLHPSYRSTSEDHLPRDTLKVQLAARPSSTTPEANRPQRYITRRGDAKAITEDLNYLTDKHPRSRKPIFVQPSVGIVSNSDNNEAGSQKALHFWKQIDRQNTIPNKPILKKTRSDSPQMFTSHTQVHNKIFLPSVLQHENTKPGSRGSSPFKPATPTMPETAKPLEISYQTVLGEISKDDIKRKSSNLEEALDELEAIYNSLRLGDEDLLDRAEQREKETQDKKLPVELLNSYPSYSSRGALSDSSFSYEPFDAVDSPRRKKMMRKNRTLDIKQDDMAFRKLNKYRANTIGDPQSHISKVSYLLSSPVYSEDHHEEEIPKENNNEPDITKDDVVYRNVKHLNNSLKVVDPQPPFGIPIGPITPGANSDYLHAKPEDIFTPTFKPRKIPDIVKDDLAFRNLRKDNNKGPALPSLSTEDFKNNNSDHIKFDLNYLKKKRAQRSLSANIGSLMHSDIIERAKLKQKPSVDVGNEFESFKTLTDIADAMEIARSVLKEKENKITNTRKAFMSDTDTKYIHPITNRSNMLESRQNFFNSLKNSHANHKCKPSSPRLGEDKLSAKPPRGQTPERIRSPKESTPIPVSPLEDKQALQSESTSSSLEDLLNALAEEAKETTERITNELNMLREERDKEKQSTKCESVVEEQKDEVVTRVNNKELIKKLSEIDAVSEHAKLCEKLLECVVDSSELMATTKTEEEIVKRIDEEAAVAESANVVMSRTGSKEDKVSEESDHDYENLVSDKELNVDDLDLKVLPETKEPEESRSSFEEHKAELIASFQELKEHMEDIKLPLRRNSEDNHGNNDQTSAKVDSVYDNIETVDRDDYENVGVTDKQSTRRSRSRLPRWLRFHSVGSLIDQSTDMSETPNTRAERIARYKEERRRQLAAQFGDAGKEGSPSRLPGGKDGAEGPRPTRASKLRLAALASQESQGAGGRLSEKSPTPPATGSDGRSSGSKRPVERDKSAKRKSNLNRSTTSEEVPTTETGDDLKSRRRQRRFFPPEVLEQTPKYTASEKTKNEPNTTASIQYYPPTSPITASSSSTKLTPRKSQLSMHMENARRGISPAYSEMGKYKPFAKRAVTSSPKPTSPRFNLSDQSQPSTAFPRLSSSTKLEDDNSKAIANRMEELTNITKQTLARVQMLTSKTRESPKREPRRPVTSSPCAQPESKLSTRHNRISPSVEKTQPSSILKKKSIEEPPCIAVEPTPVLPIASGPVSILKRKVSQDDHNKHEGNAHSSNNTPPVTFSPSVVEPTSTKRKQGILKKRRSLDESTVMRHRSCSPDVANKSDSRSILKNQRRSSLEELRRTQSPEAHLQSILKRKTSRTEDDDHSLNSPQGILKRRSGASSAGSTTSTPHVSITTAVILAAAGGAEMILDSDSDHVKPILKKKSISEDSYHSDPSEVPKPILKKKSSTDTDDSEEKPKPILKLPKSAEQENQETRYFKHNSSSEAECEVRVIRRQNASRGESPRPRLSFCYEDSSIQEEAARTRTSRRSHTICTDFNVASSSIISKEEDRNLRKARPLSVHDLVKTFEISSSTGAIPKRSSMKRGSERYKTQPVTSNEYEARNFDVRSLLDFTSSLENDSNLNNFYSSSLQNTTSPDHFSCGKMSSDSAFQSLGDGLELDQDEDTPQTSENEPTEIKIKIDPPKMELQMKALAEEAKKMKLGKSNAGIEKYKSRKSGLSDRTPRFSTQPVTFDEVQEASRKNKSEEKRGDDAEPDKSPERKGILKPPVSKRTAPPQISPTELAPRTAEAPPRKAEASPRSADLSPASAETSPDKDDEGISSASDSDSSTGARRGEAGRRQPRQARGNGDSTSEGESSGGREVRSIFRQDDKLRIKNALESVLSKSRFGDDCALLQPTNKVTVRRSQTQNEMPQAVADLRAKLQLRGESEWRKRVPHHNNATDELKLLKEKNRYNDELSEKSLLTLKKDELDASSRQWRARVEKSDAEKFSVAGKMGEKIRDAVPTINIPTADENRKRTPQAKRYRSKEGPDSTPTSPEKNSHFDLTRSKSTPFSTIVNLDTTGSPTKFSSRKVSVANPDDITFRAFFKSVEESTTTCDRIDLAIEDFDAVERQSLLVIKKNVQVQKRRGASRNPIKALASRTDISNEYTEIITGAAEREKRRLNIEKLAKNSNKALEALAGLASNEDFKSVALKKSTGPTGYLPWKDLMLLQVKGRRQIQTRLVEPTANSINEGDNYILITPSALYIYNGTYSNVIEQSRALDVANHIRKTGDMGCKVEKIHSINTKTSSPKHTEHFWKLLGSEGTPETVDAGHPDEDETYESNILHTNMIYTLEDDELAPFEKYWGSTLKVEMLQDTSIIVFDFGSEMYVWSGKNAPLDKKRQTMKLAKEMWEEGYNYSECQICPLNISSILGDRKQKDLPLKASKRPSWALFAKITQHRETVLFREKFLDWPDFSRVIRVRSDENIREVSGSIDIKPCDVDEMIAEKDPYPDLVVETTHLGRGDKYFDEETRRLFEYETLEVKGWHISENSYEALDDKSIGQFYDGDSYIYCWNFRQTVRGRELNGTPSRHAAVGRDRCIFFCWQGCRSSINEKGTAALLTVELDKQNAPQVRVAQGSEPAAFLRLFDGSMVVRQGKRGESEEFEKPMLFIARGEKEDETYLMEVPLGMSSLRSRSSFIIVDIDTEQVTIWHGAKSSQQKRKVVREAVRKLMVNKPAEMYLDDFEEDLDIVVMEEGSESEDFFDVMGNNRASYNSLLNCEKEYVHTPRLFRMSSVTGSFLATEVLCPHRSEHSSPYPFNQTDLYSASQPALFLIDDKHDLWLWQGFWPEKEAEAEDLSDQTGSGAVRWQAERRAAMRTAVDYWRRTRDGGAVSAHLVWAGLEPLAFKGLFPCWEEREEVKRLNLKEGKKMGDMLPLERELALLSRTIYPLSELLQRPLPEGVDPTNIERYLSNADFRELLSMTKDEFEKLPSWKKTALKKEKGLF
ncbi:unnamed protein product [Phaedon cochleariae]|uniref:HP domain-containing protein n=1 Tax=Phaedon cochleariae TaxID=80249 RepID=A0A9P0DMS5_PHACE|nr:unnamed protein product [Phaedon cochleariae]